METFARRIAQKLVQKEIIDEENTEFYRYSIECTILYAINIITILVLALIVGEVYGCIIFLLAFGTLRSYCGGVHLKHWYTCYIVSCIIIVVMAVFPSVVHVNLIIAAVCAAFCVVGIWICAPCIDRKNPKEQEEIIILRSKARVRSALLLLAVIILGYLGRTYEAMLCVEAICLNFVLLCMGLLANRIE